MTKVWRVAGKITVCGVAVRRVAVRRTGPVVLAMTRWGVIARTRGNTPATTKREKAEEPGKRKGEEKREERNPAFSKRRKVFSVICR
jgi:hypothetical protein